MTEYARRRREPIILNGHLLFLSGRGPDVEAEAEAPCGHHVYAYLNYTRTERGCSTVTLTVLGRAACLSCLPPTAQTGY